ncbi:hypothetical protein SAMN05444380_11176 [Thermophagus xiamenensis]|uniref:Uncharacterized protein n=2 Tax=Thermophagus xiamenensis TaxID=385682 RepID=A0A1I2AII5_9BACT|nr:hypothetical protein SAMN05444380_11176 [Thermophagus xiamenensis]
MFLQPQAKFLVKIEWFIFFISLKKILHKHINSEMGTMTKTTKNPLIYQSQKQKILDKAKDMFMKYLEQFAESKNLPEKDLSLIKKSFEEVYLEKKASYIFEDKLKDLNGYLNQALIHAISGTYKNQTKTENFTNVFYYRNKKSEIAYERY